MGEGDLRRVEELEVVLVEQIDGGAGFSSIFESFFSEIPFISLSFRRSLVRRYAALRNSHVMALKHISLLFFICYSRRKKLTILVRLSVWRSTRVAKKGHSERTGEAEDLADKKDVKEKRWGVRKQYICRISLSASITFALYISLSSADFLSLALLFSDRLV